MCDSWGHIPHRWDSDSVDLIDLRCRIVDHCTGGEDIAPVAALPVPRFEFSESELIFMKIGEMRILAWEYGVLATAHDWDRILDPCLYAVIIILQRNAKRRKYAMRGEQEDSDDEKK
jgi:hypothetical protein